MAGKFHFYPEEWDDISNEAKDLIKKMLEINPGNRLSAEEVLKHPWMKMDLD